mgnify:CR=1 FL=1
MIDCDLSLRVAAGGDPFTVRADLTVADGETLVVLGPSGSGKSLLLEALAGVREGDGRVVVGDHDVTDRPPEDRGLGFVFQEYALFPHRTVRENVAFGTRYHESTCDPAAVLDDLGIADLADRSPDTLSGGEKQRVALARSLVVDPAAFLLDEPLAALDAPTRAELRGVLADTLADETAIYVTHDRTTARALGDRVAVLADGQVRQVGSATDVFERPRSPFVARFTGANCLSRERLPASLEARLPAGEAVAIRPEHLRLVDGAAAGGSTADGSTVDWPTVEGTVSRSIREETTHRTTVDFGSQRLNVLTQEPPATGATVRVAIPEDRCHVVEGAADSAGQSSL